MLHRDLVVCAAEIISTVAEAMNVATSPERATLKQHILRVSVRDASLMLTVELRNSENKPVAAARARLTGPEHVCEFDLRQLPEGVFTIHTRPARRGAFGAQFVATLRARRSGPRSATEDKFIVVADSSFSTPAGAVSAHLLADLAQGAVCLRIAPQTNRLPRAAGVPVPGVGDRPPSGHGPLVASLTKDLDSRMWGGFSVPATAELTRIRMDPAAPRGERIGAAWSLARWYAYNGDHDRAYEAIRSMHAVAGARIISKMVVLLEVECLCRLGQSSEARRILDGVIAGQPAFDPDLCLSYANTQAGDASDDQRLDRINRVFRRAGLATIARQRPGEPLTLGNLCAPDAAPAADGTEPRVSVIVPAYNSSATIGLALESLVRQTWTNIEIIVVDDCSTDGTWDLVRDVAARHDAIRPFRQDQNQGAYAARNRGLELATGEFFTTHDADDWAHPQQIAVQVRRMMGDPNIKASRCHWVRVSEDLRFLSLWRSEEALINPSWPSFMFGRQARDQLGVWDRVRAQADSEFIERARVIFGDDSVVDHRPDVPLRFSLVSDTSLTRSGATSIATVPFGLRSDYQAAAAWWHRLDTNRSRLKLAANPPKRPFPAPATILPDRPARPPYDVLLVGDTNSESHAYRQAVAYVGDLIRRGKRVGIFHWPDFDSYGRTNAAIWALAQAGQVDVISAGEKVTAATVLVADPMPLRHVLDRFPAVTWTRLQVNAARDGLAGRAGEAFDAGRVENVLSHTFGDTGEWQPLPGDTAVALESVMGSRVRHTRTGDVLLSFDRDYLSRQRDLFQAGDEAVARQVAVAIRRAETALSRGGRLSVVDKKAVPPSGDRHDYMTIAPFWWPDPKDPDGPHLHYRDGVRIPAMQVGHPDSFKYDVTTSRYLFDDLASLSLAGFFTGDARFAQQAQRVIRTWFIDPDTRMNPHLRFAQVRLGQNENRGTPFGVIEFREIHHILDSVRLLDLDGDTRQGLRRWLGEYLTWLRESRQGREECATENNHGSWYDLQVLAIAHFLDNRAEVDATLARAQSRIGKHFDSDGRQPFEIGRTLSQHYCAFNLQAWIYLAAAAEVLGVNLWDHRSAYGGGLQAGLLWFLRQDGQPWPYQQIQPFDRTRLVPLCEAYQHAYGSADEDIVRAILADVNVADEFANVGVRPFWQLGSPTAAARHPLASQ